MKLFSVKTAYHSTTQKGLTKFRTVTDNEVAFKGEGAMVHGWGLYLQEDKQLNIFHYKNNLGMIRKETDRYDGINVHVVFDDDGMVSMSSDDVSESNQPFMNFLDAYCYTKSTELVNDVERFGTTDNTTYVRVKDVNAFFDYIIESNPDITQSTKDMLDSQRNNVERIAFEIMKHVDYDYPSQYTVEIPDDMVIIDANELFENLPEQLKELYNSTIFDDEIDKELNRLRLRYPSISMNTLKMMWDLYYAKGTDSLRIVINDKLLRGESPISDEFSNFSNRMEVFNDICHEFISIALGTVELKPPKTYKGLYDTISSEMSSEQKTSEFMMSKGIDGMEYNGHGDGHCYVIYNCEKLKIIKEE